MSRGMLPSLKAKVVMMKEMCASLCHGDNVTGQLTTGPAYYALCTI